MVRDIRWLDEREGAAWRGFLSMQSRLLSHLGRDLQRRTGLSEADYAVLVELSETPGGRLRIGELGERLNWEKSRLSKQIGRMTIRGQVIREECPGDARGTFVVLTETGRDAVAVAAPFHVEQVRKLFVDVLTPDQLDALVAISSAVVDRLAQPDVDDTACEQART
ncbi:MarR family winged helix-turn-helix transcriptional regulator [Rhodococcus jostii]